MILMTMIARVADALPLAASIQEDEQVSKKTFLTMKNFFRFKVIFRIFVSTVGQEYR